MKQQLSTLNMDDFKASPRAVASGGTVSVVIPAYNAAKFLPDALESVFRQTVPALEVIVVDDGSTDETPEVMEPFRERAVYLRKQNSGPSSARNLGTLHARGEWIAFLDADDQWVPERLERQLALADRTKADLVFSDAAVVDVRSATSALTTASWLTSISRKSDVESALVDSVMVDPFRFFMEIGCVVLLSTVLVRRSCIETAGYFDEKIGACEDWELLFRLSPHCRIAFSAESLIIRRIYGGNLSLNCSIMSRGALQLWEKAAELDVVRRTPKWRRFVRTQTASQYMQAGVLKAEQNELTEAKMNLTRSLEVRFTARAAVHRALLLLPPSLANAIRHFVRPLHRRYAEFREGKIAF